MLGDLLTDQEQRINDANPATDEQLERDLEAVNEVVEALPIPDAMTQPNGYILWEGFSPLDIRSSAAISATCDPRAI